MTDQRTRLFLGLLAGILAAGQGQAQGAACADHSVVVERLADGYGESRQSAGIAANNTLVEVYASVETGSWTIIVTQPGGPTCLVASGFGFEVLAEDPAPGGQGA